MSTPTPAPAVTERSAAMRGAVMQQADVIVTFGRKLDFQPAFGSPAVFGDTKFVRIADAAAELRDNRRGAAEILVTREAASSDAKSGRAWAPDLQALAAWDDAERAWRAGH